MGCDCVIVVDTQAWFWLLVAPNRLTTAALDRLTKEDRVLVPAIVCWELAMMEAKGRVRFTSDALEFCRAGLDWDGYELAPLTPEIAVRAARLGAPFHNDPADRLIVASALESAVPLVTADRQIRASGVVETVW